MYGIEWGKYRVRAFALPSNILIGRIELPSPTPKILQMSMRQHSRTTPPPPTTVDYIPDHKGARGKEGNWLHLRQHWILQQTFSIEGSEAVNHEGQTPCTWACWDPQQFVETSPWGHTEDPKRDTKQDMDLCGFSWPVESSNSDPDPQTKQGLHWPTQL